MQLKIAKQVCFIMATFFLLLLFFFNSCKKVPDRNRNSVSRVDTIVVPKDTIRTEFMNVTSVLLDSGGNPLSGVFYTIIPTSIPSGFSLPYNPYIGGYTNAAGKLYAVAITNTANVLTVYQYAKCGTALYSKSFNTLNTDIDLGNIIVPPDTVTSIISGTVVDCSLNSVKTGSVILEEDYSSAANRRTFKAQIKPNGTFQFSLPVCNKTDSLPVIIYVADVNGFQTGNRVYFGIHYPVNNIGKISACNNSDTSEFINYTVDSNQYLLYSPSNPNYHPENPAWTFLRAGNQELHASSPGIYFGIDGYLAVGKPGLTLVEFDLPNLSEETDTNPLVTISEDGPVGGYLAGNIRLKVVGIDSTTKYNASCTFRVKRQQ